MSCRRLDRDLATSTIRSLRALLSHLEACDDCRDAADNPPSPCIGVCELDDTGAGCRGSSVAWGWSGGSEAISRGPPR